MKDGSAPWQPGPYTATSATLAWEYGLFGRLPLAQLQQRAYRLYEVESAATGHVGAAWRMAADALCAVRYSGDACYDYRRHLHRWQLWQPSPLHAAQARPYALPTKCCVHVLGAAQSGILVDTRFLTDCTSPYPAPWYVVAYKEGRTCRAHGSEELEPEP
ncbi:hypothetical protein [Streptomyces sp. NPDC090022]|uniref:hypothetical protein n=1 Tax=Streptomyces sp. NPDC090022 TaxID=3365920 RepID=UPI00382C9739